MGNLLILGQPIDGGKSDDQTNVVSFIIFAVRNRLR